MKQFQRLGVFLHDSPADDIALTYTARFATLAEPESILCIHMSGGNGEAAQPDPDPDEFTARVLAKLPKHVA